MAEYKIVIADCHENGSTGSEVEWVYIDSDGLRTLLNDICPISDSAQSLALSIERVLEDEEDAKIDTSDIPEMDESFFATAELKGKKK